MTPMDRLCAAARLWLATRGHEDAERGLAEAVRALDAQPVASAQSDECGAVDGVFGRGLGPVCTRPRRHSGGHEAVCPVTGRVVSGWPADVARPVSLDEQAHPMSDHKSSAGACRMWEIFNGHVRLYETGHRHSESWDSVDGRWVSGFGNWSDVDITDEDDERYDAWDAACQALRNQPPTGR